jgi:peptide/nickel transport system ATP-binding protein
MAVASMEATTVSDASISDEALKDDTPALLTIRNLSLEFHTRSGKVVGLRDVSLELHKGETLGLVGESGSGKSILSYATMGISDPAARITSGSINFDGMALLDMSESEMQTIRGREMAMVFQNPRLALNPIRKVGQQIEDVLKRHGAVPKSQLQQRAIALLHQVRIPDPQRRYHAYPAQMSGGQCQRIMIAIALACTPALLIADEPTTGLDVTTQATVMSLIRELAQESRMATILITHDLALASQYCDRIAVMRFGEIVEIAKVQKLFAEPQHKYTQALIQAIPSVSPSGVAQQIPASLAGNLRVSHAQRLFALGREGFNQPVKQLHAVDDVSFDLASGTSLGLVGESGCGKSTLARLVARLIDITGGEIEFDSENIAGIKAACFVREGRRADIQMVFQDPSDSLNPRYSAFDCIAEPLRLLRHLRDTRELSAKVHEAASDVGLSVELLSRFPHQLSGGQKARVGIARAIALRPKLLVLDEPTAALDVSVQAVVLTLLADLRQKFKLSYLFISHDLNVVRILCDHVLVMYLGKVVESGPVHEVFANPAHPYTRALVSAIPKVEFPVRRWKGDLGEAQSPVNPDPKQCRYAGRCPNEQARCLQVYPSLQSVRGSARQVACHYPDLPYLDR